MNKKTSLPSQKTNKKKVVQMMLLAASLILIIAFSFVALLIAWSPGKTEPYLDENGALLAGSLSEKIFVPINGVEQGMFIKSKDETNPVLLFLHGGPGMPEYWMTQSYPTGLDEIFTVVWWDQRGAGISYHPDIPTETLNPEQIIADTLAVTNYLRERFHQDKIYLMGHSGGSYFGIQAAARAPELYHAYIGMGQMSYQAKSEILAYPYMLEQYTQNGNTKMVQLLEKAQPTLAEPLPVDYAKVRDAAMHELGIGTTRDMDSVITGIFFPTFRFREYTLSEKINLWRGKILSARLMRHDMFTTDLTRVVTDLEIPVYFFHGRYDLTCSYSMAQEYLVQLNAPVKGFYTFENSAHSPLFEEPERARQILLEDVLAGTNSMAD